MGEKFGKDNNKGAEVINFEKRRRGAEEKIIMKKIEKLEKGIDYKVSLSVLSNFIADHYKDKPDNVKYLLRRVKFFQGTFLNFIQSKKAGKTVLFEGELEDNKGIFFVPLKNIGRKIEFIPIEKSKK